MTKKKRSSEILADIFLRKIWIFSGKVRFFFKICRKTHRNLTLGFLGFFIAQSWVFNLFWVATLVLAKYVDQVQGSSSRSARNVCGPVAVWRHGFNQQRYNFLMVSGRDGSKEWAFSIVGTCESRVLWFVGLLRWSWEGCSPYMALTSVSALLQPLKLQKLHQRSRNAKLLLSPSMKVATPKRLSNVSDSFVSNYFKWNR